MPEFRTSPFRRTRIVQAQIEEFLDTVSRGAMMFRQGAHEYVANGYSEETEQRYDQLSDLEKRGDELRRGIELALYTEMLIPEVRGDVLGVLDDLDRLLDGLKKQFLTMIIERFELPLPEDVKRDVKGEFESLVDAVTNAIDMTVVAARAYFRDPSAVRDHIHKVSFHESESDRITIKLRRLIWESNMKLQQKMMARSTVVSIDELADQAEDAGDRLAIYAVKRSL